MATPDGQQHPLGMPEPQHHGGSTQQLAAAGNGGSVPSSPSQPRILVDDVRALSAVGSQGSQQQQHAPPATITTMPPEHITAPESYIQPTKADRVADNTFIAATLVLASLIWLMALISQAVVTVQTNNLTVRTAWFALILQLLLIILTTTLLLTTYLPPYHIQLSTLSSLVLVFAILTTDANIYQSPLLTAHTAAQRALSAAWLITALINLLWIFYFTSPPQSPIVHAVHSIPPLTAQKRYSQHVEAGAQSRTSGFFATNPRVPPHAPTSPTARQSTLGPSRVQSGLVMPAAPPAPGNLADAMSLSDLGSEAGRRKSGWGSMYTDREPGAPPASAPQEANPPPLPTPDETSKVYTRAEAMFTYNAEASDPNELSFKKGEILVVLDRSGKWWEARRSDGKTGMLVLVFIRRRRNWY
ncbi:hypothetical protein FA15DRAFT_654082 [Coprinopsis marcescibilis]|uniref:SH3 domain-containing protein n=1 Tax=Coprinopsis marcescibilis TaxID=230819 RepID=A0A5C3L443_COPMA|nr:hypothetical protein FA15DRAFT_654082 [Coprinopsis marcescibilis]